MREVAQFLIYAHAAFGGIALLSGIFALLFKKGSQNHKKSGKVFFFSLLLSSIVAIIVTHLPDHYSPFLLAIGIFTLYLLLSGFRALRYKQKEFSLFWDKVISIVMLIVGILMIILPLLINQQLNIVLTVFGSIGLLSAIRDLRMYGNESKMRENWLRLHLGNMMGAFIASFTAFLVVNQFLPPLVGWLGPTVIGTFYIVYWNRKLSGAGKKA